jgi:hypothetical protein
MLNISLRTVRAFILFTRGEVEHLTPIDDVEPFN